VGPPCFSCGRSGYASTVRLSVSGELDIATAPQLEHALAGAPAEAALVILDLRRAAVHGLKRRARRSSASDAVGFRLGRRAAVTIASPSVTEIPSIVLEGEIDPGAVIAIQRRVVEALDAGQRRVVVGSTPVTVLGGATVDLLCGALRWLTRRGTTIAIAGGRPQVRRVLERCAIDGVELH
jgi:anti-anti-sigma factor